MSSINEIDNNNSLNGIESKSVVSETVDHNNDDAETLTMAKRKRYLTFIYCLVFWNFGLCVAIFGPTLLDLACQTSSTVSTMSVLYFMQNFTSLIGVFVSGMILRKKKMSILNFLLICTLMMPLCVAFMPISHDIFFLSLVMILLGFNMGCVDNIANLAILKLHSNNVSPYIQTMHFFYGVGAFLTPLIVKSFLNSNFDIKMTHSQFNCFNIEEVIKKNNTILSLVGDAYTTVSALPDKPLIKDFGEIPQLMTIRTEFTSNTKYAFWILAFVQLPAVVILVLMKRLNIAEPPCEEDEKDSHIDSSFEFSIEYIKARFTEIPLKELTFLISVMVFLFEGLQAAHGGFVFSYAMETYDMVTPTHLEPFKNSSSSQRILNRHHHQHNDEAYITALFWAFFSLGRLVSIFIATKFSAPFMILIDIIGCFIAACLMLFSSISSMIGLLYVATCMLGLFLANTTPTIYSIGEIFIGSTPTLTSFVIICAAAGEMILPVIVATLFDLVGPASLLVIELILVVLAAIIFAKFIHYTKTNLHYFGSISSFVWFQSINSTMQNEGRNLIDKSGVNYYSKMDESENF